MPTFDVELAGFQVHGSEWGSNDSGPSDLLLVPGLGGSSVDWEPAGTLLASELGAHVVAIDLPGFGRTRLGGAHASLELFVEVVHAALERLGPRTVVGNSMGGLVALLAARSDPGRIRGLVLADPALPSGGRGVGPGAVVGALRWAVAATPVIGPWYVTARKRVLGVERYVTSRLAANTFRPERVDPALRTAMVQLSRERLTYEEAGRAYSEATRSIASRWSEGLDAVRTVDARALVVHGRHDSVVHPSVLDRLRALRPEWHYEVFDDCGHLPHVEDPSRFAATVAAWTRRVPR